MSGIPRLVQRTSLALPAMLAALVLTACTVPTNGLTGVTVDEGGHLVATLTWCDDNPPDELILYVDGDKNGYLAVYDAPPLSGRTASVRLDAPADGWQVSPGPPSLSGSIEYVLYGATRDNKNSTAHVHFHLGDRDRLSPGVVLIQDYDKREDASVDVLVSRKEFEERAKDYC